MKIGVAKEIKPDEYRVALTPGGRAASSSSAATTCSSRPGAGAGSAFPDDAYTAVGARIASRRRGLGAVRAAAEGQGADRGRVPAAARGARPLHVPAHRRRRAAHARARRQRHRRASRTRRSRPTTARLPLLAPMSEVAGRLAAQAGAYFLEKPLGGRGLLLGGVPGVAPGPRRRDRRRHRRLQRRRDRARPRRAGDDPRALDRPHAPPGGDPLRPRHAADVVDAPDRGVGRRGGRRDRRGAHPRRARAEARHPRDDRAG